MDKVALIQAYAPILIAIITIIPTIISNRKKTQKSIEETDTKLSAEIASVKKDFNRHVAECEETRAKSARYKILRFYDEVCAGVVHSESHWEDILDEIDFYEVFCDTHPMFKNNRGHAAIEYLKETYRKVKSKGGFLTHEKGA